MNTGEYQREVLSYLHKITIGIGMLVGILSFMAAIII